MIVTGLLSYVAYGPQFGQAIPGDVGVLRLPQFDWPTSPSWLYRLTQGLHVGLGLVLVPVVLAKLWSVTPRLFAWPPARSAAQVLERLSLLLLVGGILFEIVTGILNIQYDYVFGFSFYAAHYVGAWVFLAAFVAHVVLKLPHMVRGPALPLAARGAAHVAGRDPARGARPRDPDRTAWSPDDPARPTMSRRGALALVGGGSLLVAALTAGQTVGGPLRGLAILLPRGRTTAAADGGPNGFPVNKTFAASGDRPRRDGRRLAAGAARRRRTRPARPRRPRRVAASTPRRCRSPASRAGRACRPGPGCGCATSPRWPGFPQPASAVVARWSRAPFAQATLTAGQVLHPDALLALR